MKESKSILESIFKRKGGEGERTKIITDGNKDEYLNQLIFLKDNEQPLLCFKEDETNWFLLTNDRVLEEKEGVRISILISDLAEATPALQEEFKHRINNKEDFTRLSLRDWEGNQYIVKIEKGKPYQGIYQVLHHLVSKNRNS